MIRRASVGHPIWIDRHQRCIVRPARCCIQSHRASWPSAVVQGRKLFFAPKRCWLPAFRHFICAGAPLTHGTLPVPLCDRHWPIVQTSKRSFGASPASARHVRRPGGGVDDPSSSSMMWLNSASTFRCAGILRRRAAGLVLQTDPAPHPASSGRRSPDEYMLLSLSASSSLRSYRVSCLVHRSA